MAKTEPKEQVSFLASFPGIQSAIKFDGLGGARIQLEIPEVEVGNFIKAMMWRGKRLRVTIEPLNNNEEQQNAVQERPERKSKRAAS